MNKVFYYYLLFFLASFSLVAQGQKSISEKTEQEIRTLICHKWFPDSLQMGGEKISAKIAGIEKDFIYFHRDGTFSDPTTKPGDKNNWQYNHQTKSITTEGGVKKILVIDERILVLSADMDGEKVKIFLKKHN